MKYIFQAELTNNCNYSCLFCPQRKLTRQRGYMSRDLFDICVEQAVKHAKVFTLGFFGEQMLHPDFSRFVKKIPLKRNFQFILNSNWSLVSRGKFGLLSMFDSIRISLDAPNADLYRELCPGPVGYEELTHNIIAWLASKYRPPTDLIYVVSSKNRYGIPEFVRMWTPYLAVGDKIVVKSVLSYGGKMSDSHMKPNKCVTPDQKRFTVAWNGDCTPCNLDTDLELKAGNLLETPDIPSIVCSKAWQDRMLQMRSKSGICSRCFDAQNHSVRTYVK